MGEESPKNKKPVPNLVKESLAKMKSDSDVYSLVAAFTLFLTLQVVTSTGRYSGLATPPMYGDFEAQRHWMEVTVNLPVSEW